MKHKICLFDVTASHYRKDIFTLMDKTFNVDFYFGDMMPSIKQMDKESLQGYKKTLHVKQIGPFFWYKGMVGTICKGYDTLLFDGDYRSLSTWVSLLICKVLNKRTYLWTHGFYGSESGLKQLVKKCFVSVASGCLLYGDYAKDIMINRYGISPSMLSVIHNSLNYDEQKELREKLTPSEVYHDKFNNSDPVILFIGRLTEIKKLDMIIEAQKILIDRGKAINVVYVGDGPMRESLEHLADKYSLSSRIWFYGASYDDAVNSSLIYNADICVSPGNIGLTAIHSLSFGTPAITHNKLEKQMPEFEVIKSGRTGAFFDYDDVKSLADSIEGWLLSAKDRNLVRSDCFSVIDKEWNPYYQISVLKNVIKDEA